MYAKLLAVVAAVCKISKAGWFSLLVWVLEFPSLKYLLQLIFFL